MDSFCWLGSVPTSGSKEASPAAFPESSQFLGVAQSAVALLEDFPSPGWVGLPPYAQAASFGGGITFKGRDGHGLQRG